LYTFAFIFGPQSGFTHLVYVLPILITQLTAEPKPYSVELPGSLLELEDDPGVDSDGPIFVDVTAQLIESEVLVRGSVKTQLKFACSRCIEFYSTTMKDSTFVRCFPLSEIKDPLDLGEDIRESIFLKFSSFPLCSPDCKGLCPVCKQNLNKSACACEVKQVDDRWGGLDGLDL